MVMFPGWMLAAAGANVTSIVHVPFAGSVDGLRGQLFVCPNWALATMLVMLSAVLPVLLSVTASGALFVPTT
jgi:hypothetical protein